MADDRPAEDMAEMLARLNREMADLRTTVAARTSRGPTGVCGLSMSATAPPDALLLNGQTVSRSTYSVLWAWVAENGYSPTPFGAGDGSTTFTLPDARARAIRVVASGGTAGELTGADTKSITTANMPGHDHDVSVNITAVGTHQHNFGTDGDGQHGGHHPTSQALAAAGSDLGLSPWNASTAFLNDHFHGGTTDSGGGHGHINSVSETTVGSGAAFNVQQAGFGLYVFIWT